MDNLCSLGPNDMCRPIPTSFSLDNFNIAADERNWLPTKLPSDNLLNPSTSSHSSTSPAESNDCVVNSKENVNQESQKDQVCLQFRQDSYFPITLT